MFGIPRDFSQLMGGLPSSGLMLHRAVPHICKGIIGDNCISVFPLFASAQVSLALRFGRAVEHLAIPQPQHLSGLY